MAKYGTPSNFYGDDDLLRMRENALLQWQKNRATNKFADAQIWAYLQALENTLRDDTTTMFRGVKKYPKWSKATQAQRLPMMTLKEDSDQDSKTS